MQKIPSFQTDPETGKSIQIGHASMHHVIDEIAYDGLDHLKLMVLGKDGEWKCLYEIPLVDLYLSGTIRFPALLKLFLWGHTPLGELESMLNPQSGEPEQDVASVS